MLIDPPKTKEEIEAELDEEDNNDEIDYSSLDNLFFQPSAEESDLATEDALALNQFMSWLDQN